MSSDRLKAHVGIWGIRNPLFLSPGLVSAGSSDEGQTNKAKEWDQQRRTMRALALSLDRSLSTDTYWEDEEICNIEIRLE